MKVKIIQTETHQTLEHEVNRFVAHIEALDQNIVDIQYQMKPVSLQAFAYSAMIIYESKFVDPEKLADVVRKHSELPDSKHLTTYPATGERTDNLTDMIGDQKESSD